MKKREVVRFNSIVLKGMGLLLLACFVVVDFCVAIIIESEFQWNFWMFFLPVVILSVWISWKLHYSNYKNSYVELLDNAICISAMPVDKEKKRKQCKSQVEFDSIIRYGYSIEILNRSIQQMVFSGAYNQGTYACSEIFFETNKGEIIALQSAQYSKKQMKKLINIIYAKTKKMPVGRLKKLVFVQ